LFECQKNAKFFHETFIFSETNYIILLVYVYVFDFDFLCVKHEIRQKLPNESPFMGSFFLVRAVNKP